MRPTQKSLRAFRSADVKRYVLQKWQGALRRRGNTVLVLEGDWNAMAETLHLLSVPGMRESIKEGMETLIEEYSNELDY